MAREVIVYDQRTGRAIRIMVPDRSLGEYQQRYDVPDHYDDHSVSPYRSEYGGRRSDKREKRARLVSTMFMLFIASWIPTGMGHPGATILLWSAGFSLLLYKWIR